MELRYIKNLVFTDDTIMTLAVATKGIEMPEELARCVYKNVLDDNLRQILNVFNLYLKEHERE
jgi:hypothetical protein